ncbi:MAG: hypothetical protein NDJ18_07520 [candidate division Zixibacteria bacterium]|nr:hypothetical protein [candidate division Zixibacteria bacterium]
MMFTQGKLNRVPCLLMAGYLLLFLAWTVPHHACDHTPKDLQNSSSFASGSPSPDGHHPDLCQICKTHGQLDVVFFDAVSLNPMAPSNASITPTTTNFCSQFSPQLSPRSPPPAS